GQITNFGTKTSSYDLEITGVDWITLDKKTVLLENNESKDIIFNITPPFTDENKTFSLQLTATSQNETITKDFNITLLSKKECCNSQLKITPSKIIVEEGGRGEKILVEVKNTGLMDNSFDLELTGPNWSYMNPPKVDVLSNQTSDVWIYIAPPLDTKNEEFQLNVLATSECSNTAEKSTVTVRKQGALLGKLEFDLNQTQTQFETKTAQTTEIIIKNIGLKKLYNIKAEFSDEFDFNSTTIDVLIPNEEKTLFVTLTPKTTETGEFEGKAIIISDEQVLIKYFDYTISKPTIQITNVSGELEQTNGKNTVMLEFEITNTSNETRTINDITVESNNVIFEALTAPLTINANTTKSITTSIKLPNDLNASFETTITATSNEKDYLFKDTIEFQKNKNNN
ncbi:MAG: hypothetical protein KAS30_01110, partial [Candidatus Diapherotrites archaeon]|nr:hypothetical protein [Candidatus Diapherotrites archaeon]